jgi:hypothetical protein
LLSGAHANHLAPVGKADRIALRVFDGNTGHLEIGKSFFFLLFPI